MRKILSYMGLGLQIIAMLLLLPSALLFDAAIMLKRWGGYGF